MIDADTMRTINKTKIYENVDRNVKPKFCWKNGDFLVDIERKMYKCAYNASSNNTRTNSLWYDFSGNDNLCTKWIVVNKLREVGYKVRMTNDYKKIYIQW